MSNLYQFSTNGKQPPAPPTMPPSDYVTHGEFQDFRRSVDDKFAKADERFARIEARLEQTASKADVQEVRVEMHAMKAELVKWIVGTAIALGAAAITVMTFVLNNATPKAPTAQPAPIIIQVPAPPPQSPAAK